MEPSKVYRIQPDKTMPHMARVYCNERVVACVYRRRKTKRSAWMLTISPISDLGTGLGVSEYIAHHAAIAAVARQWESPDAP